MRMLLSRLQRLLPKTKSRLSYDISEEINWSKYERNAETISEQRIRRKVTNKRSLKKKEQVKIDVDTNILVIT